MMRKKVFKRMTAGVLTAAMMATLLTGCGSKSASEDTPIYIGTSFPLTGSVAADGMLIMDAIQLAVDQVNEEGGIKGRQVEIVKEDDEASPTSAAAVANKFVENDDILGVISSYNSSCMFAQVDVYAEAGLPSISPVATNPGLTGISDYFYRTAPNDADVGAEGASFCSDLGWKNVALLYENDDYGLGIADEFRSNAEELGMSIATEQTFVYGETVDFSTILTAVADSGADGMFIAGLVTESGMICEQKSSYGCADVGIVGANGLYSPAMLEYGDAVEGLYVLGEFSAEADNELTKKFVSDYSEKYGEEPGNWSALAYDAVMVMMDAMERVDGDLTRESINEALKTTDYEGVSGTYQFVDCNCTKSEMRFVVKDGKFEIYE
ncbi:MAG TPA: ABC transporter substrate-binding protein [Lachnospiraceae bacterium]|nr:ABC transporter substrate-binding protein [Lachnospiraceae bacterium]